MHCKALLVAASLLAATVLGKTNLTGDIVDGIPVITALDLADVPVNAITRYYFLAGVAQGTINYHVPVFVARGTNSSLHTGRRLSISSTVHGDEYNGVRVVQNVFGLLEKTVKAGKFNGTIIGIPTVNMNGIMHNQRNCTFSFRARPQALVLYLSNTISLQSSPAPKTASSPT